MKAKRRKGKSRENIFKDKNSDLKEDGRLNFDRRSIGEQTRDKLNKNGIVSPSTAILIEILPNLKIAPKKEFKSDKEKQKWILEMKIKYSK